MPRLIQLIIPCVLLSGCFGRGEGVEVPKDEIYFPVGLAVDQGAKHLFVVSSDFDLQFNGGAVQSYDLDALSRALPTRCASDADCKDDAIGQHCLAGGMCAADEESSPCRQGDRADADRLLFPGRCNPIQPQDVQTKPAPSSAGSSSVKIGAFATDAILRQGPDDAQRLFIPVRGDSTLHWLDVEGDGTLQCGQDGSDDRACNDQHRAGDDPSVNSRNIKLNVEPFAIDATADAKVLVVTNQTTGTASLFVTDTWTEGPKLAFALSSAGIPSRPVGLAAVPGKSVFMMTFRDSAQVRLLSYVPDGSLRPYLVDGGGVPIDANSVGSDSRGIAVDGAQRAAATARCAADDAACISEANLAPLDVYVANRSPSSLLIGRTRPPQEYPYFFQSVPLTAGPSRVVVGQVTGLDGAPETRVFVACFDSRRIFVYDPQRSRIETEILTGRGPHALTVDPGRQLLYVGHFTDSYVGVYSLDLAHPATYGTMLGTLGAPKSPRSTK